MVSVARRSLLLAALPLAGCAAAPNAPDAPGPGAGAAMPALRRFAGGFLASASPQPGQLPRPGSGPYVKLQAPAALALRGFELLVADAASGRLWRVDLLTQTLTAVAGGFAGTGVPAGLTTALWLGPDRSAWVLDGPSRQVLRFAVDGRLLQTWRTGSGAPAGLAVLDGGATLALADTAFGRWIELRSGGAVVLTVQPHRPLGGEPGEPGSSADLPAIGGIAALAAGRDHLFVLDAGSGAVWRVQRDGRLLDTLGQAPPGRPTAMAVDRFERVWVLDGSGRSLTRLAAGQPPAQWDASELGAPLLGGLALDEHALALSDRLGGQVLIHPLPVPGTGR